MRCCSAPSISTAYLTSNFSLVIYSTYPNGFNLSLTEYEELMIRTFPFPTLYNLKPHATSMSGYRHTDEACAKKR